MMVRILSEGQENILVMVGMVSGQQENIVVIVEMLSVGHEQAFELLTSITGCHTSKHKNMNHNHL